MKVSAVLVTRGDVDLRPVVASLPFDDIVEWDNGGDEEDLAVYGRYAGIERAEHPLIYVQDDDCILAPESFDALLAAWKPGYVVCNMPERFRPHYPDSGLVGFGALFDRDLPRQAFRRFAADPFKGLANYGWWLPGGEKFNRECDAVFTALTPLILVDVPYTDREFASDPSRLWKQPGHVAARAQMLSLARQVRDGVTA